MQRYKSFNIQEEKETKTKVRKAQNKPLGGFSIEFRDKTIDTREEFGHREIDCVNGKRNGKTVVLMTLVERKTRYGLVFKLKNKSMEEVVKVLKALKKKYGDSYYEIFKTITCDNGAEFKDAVGMSLNSDDKGTKIYYSHSFVHMKEAQMKTLIGSLEGSSRRGQISLELVVKS